MLLVIESLLSGCLNRLILYCGNQLNTKSRIPVRLAYSTLELESVQMFQFPEYDLNT